MFAPTRPRRVPTNFPQGILNRAIPAVAIQPYLAGDALELTLQHHERIHITEARGDWWFIARSMKGIEGWVPSSYVRLLEASQTQDMRLMYTTWNAAVVEAFRLSKKDEIRPKLDEKTFPWVPPEVKTCKKTSCWMRKIDNAIGACIHDVESLLKGSEGYSAAWLWKEHLKWHPDRFMKKFKDHFKEEGLMAVQDMFIIVRDLADAERAREKETRAAKEADAERAREKETRAAKEAAEKTKAEEQDDAWDSGWSSGGAADGGGVRL